MTTRPSIELLRQEYAALLALERRRMRAWQAVAASCVGFALVCGLVVALRLC